MKITKPILGLATCITAVVLISACKTMPSENATKDCSAIFETRYVNNAAKGKNNSTSEKEMPGKEMSGKEMTAEEQANKPATECKVLELKLDNNTKCEFVGSDKIDDLSKTLSMNKGNKVILIAPESQLRDLTQMAQKYMSPNVVNLKQHFDSDMFANLDFPYKGMRCDIANKRIVVWSGNKQIILTMENK